MSHSKGHSSPLRWESQNKGGTPENRRNGEGTEDSVFFSVSWYELVKLPNMHIHIPQTPYI